MKILKEFICTLISAAIVFAYLPSGLVKADPGTVEIDEIIYTLNDSDATAEVSGNVITEARDVVIPSAISCNGVDYAVTSIKASAVTSTSKQGNGAFYKAAVNSVILPEGLEKIGKEAFYGSSITSVHIPSTVRLSSSDTGVFKTCTKLTDVSISEGLNMVPAMMFYYCTSLEKLYFPSSVTKIANSAFSRDYYLLNITFLGESLSVVNGSGKTASFAVTGSDGWGNNKDTSGPSFTKYYVQSDAAEAELRRANIGNSSDTITVFEKYQVKFIYNDGNTGDYTEEIEKTDAQITLPETRRQGYVFKGWHDGGNLYDAEFPYNLSKSLVFTAQWEKDYEPENAFYKDISSHSVDNTFSEPVSIRRMFFEDMKNSAVNFTFTDENGNDISKIVLFDKNGNWVNYTDAKKYISVKTGSISDCSGLYILTDCEDGYTARVTIKKETRLVFPRISWNFDQSQFAWSSSDITIARVGADGAVYGIKSGSAVITASSDGVEYSFNVNVIGEIAKAEEDGTVPAYLDSKRPIVTEINNAIEAGDKARLLAVLRSTGSVKLSDILDIDTSEIESITDSEFLNRFAGRIMSYGSFGCSAVEDILRLSDVITREIKAGYLEGLDGTSDVENVLNQNGKYFGVDVNNEYYIANKDEVLNRFLNYTAVNAAQIKADFEEGYVIAAYRKELGYIGLQKVIVDLQPEIGYSTDGFETKNNSALYKELLDRKNVITTISALRSYIDSYVYTAPSGGGSSGGSSGGSGGGGGSLGGSLVGNNDIDVVIDKNSAENGENVSFPEPESLFGDVEKTRWSYSSIQLLFAKGAVNGYADGSFGPQNKITRAEFVKILSKAFELARDEEKENETGDEPSAHNFRDISEGFWCYKEIMAAKSSGIVTGDSENMFNPGSLITREEMAAMLYRLAVSRGIDSDGINSVKFADEAAIDNWAYLAVMQLSKMNIIKGYTDGSFKPHGYATREEAVKMIADTLLLQNSQEVAK